MFEALGIAACCDSFEVVTQLREGSSDLHSGAAIQNLFVCLKPCASLLEIATNWMDDETTTFGVSHGQQLRLLKVDAKYLTMLVPESLHTNPCWLSISNLVVIHMLNVASSLNSKNAHISLVW